MKGFEERNLTPRQIVGELDKYIIGQDDAKKNVAIAMRNRWRRMNVKEEIQGEIVPNNILLIGSTKSLEDSIYGMSKTWLLKLTST